MRAAGVELLRCGATGGSPSVSAPTRLLLRLRCSGGPPEGASGVAGPIAPVAAEGLPAKSAKVSALPCRSFERLFREMDSAVTATAAVGAAAGCC